MRWPGAKASGHLRFSDPRGMTAQSSIRVTMYVDGFNLYHGLKEHTKARKYRWLNVWSLTQALLLPGHTLERVVYFTSLPPWDQKKIARHQVYLDALSSVGVEVVKGRFQKDEQLCRGACGQLFPNYVEKLTDVRISTSLLHDAVMNRFDWAYLMTGDADQVPTLETVKLLAPEKTVRVVFPPRRHSLDLEHTAPAFIGPLNHRLIKRHVLPATIQVGNRTLEKPDTW